MRAQLTNVVLLAVATIATISSTYPSEAFRSKCPAEREIQMDTCASKMGFLGDHSFLVPKNLTAMGNYCDQLKESIVCIQSYAHDCLQGFTRQLLTSLLKRGKQQYKLICQDDQSKRNFMTNMACLSDDKIGTFHKCMDASVARFEYVQSNMKSHNRFPGICCSYQIFNRDVEATLSKLCGPNSKSTSDFVNKIVSGTAGEFFSLICDQHRSMQDCRASSKTGPIMGNLEEITRQVQAGKQRPNNKSLIPVLLAILDTSGGPGGS